MHPLWKRWTLANALGEMVGLGATLGVGAVHGVALVRIARRIMD